MRHPCTLGRLGSVLGAILVYWLIVSVIIMAENRDPTTALASLLVLYVLPPVGVVLYFFFGRNWPEIARKSKRRQQLRAIASAHIQPFYERYASTGKQLEDHYPPDGWALHNAHLIANLAGAVPLPVRTWEIYEDGDEYFDALIADLGTAQRFVHISRTMCSPIGSPMCWSSGSRPESRCGCSTTSSAPPPIAAARCAA